MGEIRKRGGVYWIRYYRNGQRHEESAHTDKHEEAKTLLHQREGDIAKGMPVSAKIGRLRFDEAADNLLSDYRINQKKSIGHVERRVAVLKKWFGRQRMAGIDAAAIRQYIEHRQEKGAANATINRELAYLRRMFVLAIEGGSLMLRPKIRLLAEHNVRQGFFEPEQFTAVLTHLPPALQAVATVAYWTGWRRNEILGLEWARVDRKAGIIRLDVGTTKNKDGREFPYAVIDDVRRVIDQQWAVHLAFQKKKDRIVPLVFHRNGRRIRSFYKVWREACRLAGCPGRLLHDCRRSAVRNLERAGVARSTAMQITGHKTESVYRRYAIVSTGDLADAARRLQTTTGTITGTIADFGQPAATSKASR